MEAAIAGLVQRFEQGTLSRRELIQGLSMLALGQILEEASLALETPLLSPSHVRAAYSGLRVLPAGDGGTETARRAGRARPDDLRWHRSARRWWHRRSRNKPS